MDEMLKAERQQPNADRSLRAITHPRRARAQPQEHRRRDSPRQARGVHRPVRLRQILARLRHHLCRGPAPLCRVALGLCAPVPGDDAEAGRRPDRRPVAGDLDRAEDDVEEPALHRRHRHRDLRLHAPALGARRRALFAGHRPADRKPDRLADGRPRAGAARRHAALSAGAGRARPQGRIPQGARRIPQEGLSARQDRRHLPRARGSADARQEIPARHRRRGRPHRGAPRHRPAPRGKLRDRAEARRGPRGDRICRCAGCGAASRRKRRPQRSTTRAGPSASCSRKNSPARYPASPFPRSSRGCSPSTTPMAPVRPAAASASSSMSTRTSSSPTRSSTLAQGRDRALGEIVLALLRADADRARQVLQVHARHQVEGSAEEDAERDPARLRRGRDQVLLRGRRALLRHQEAVRGRHHQYRAPLPRDRERVGARGAGQIFLRRALRAPATAIGSSPRRCASRSAASISARSRSCRSSAPANGSRPCRRR